MTWNPNPTARRQMLAAMKRRRRALTAREIATFLGKHPVTVLQTLYPMLKDGIVSRKRGAGWIWYWKPTGKPLQKRFTSTSTTLRSELASRFDHHVLAAALGMNAEPAAAINARVHICGGGR